MSRTTKITKFCNEYSATEYMEKMPIFPIMVECGAGVREAISRVLFERIGWSETSQVIATRLTERSSQLIWLDLDEYVPKISEPI